MRKFCLIGLMVLVSGVVMAGESFKFVGLDYKLTDEDSKPISLGVLSWSTEEIDIAAGAYCQLGFMTYKDVVRFNLGGGGAWNDDKGRVDIRPLTSITMAFSIYESSFEVGAYYAPFWGLDDKSDDPYGLMFGYLF